MERDSFVFYKDWAELRKKFPHLGAKLIDAIIDYGIYGTEPEDEEIKFCFELVKGQLDKDRTKYCEIKEKRRAAGKMGGATKGNNNASKQAKQAKQANACFDKQNKQSLAKQPVNVYNNNNNINNIIYSSSSSSSTPNVRAREGEFLKQLNADESQQFWEKSAMSLHVKIPILKSLLVDFVNENDAIGKPHKDFQDFRHHFYSWARIAIAQNNKQDRQQKTQKNESNRANNREEAKHARDAEFATHIAEKLAGC